MWPSELKRHLFRQFESGCSQSYLFIIIQRMSKKVHTNKVAMLRAHFPTTVLRCYFFRIAKVLLSNLYTVARSRELAGKSLQDEVQAEQTGPEQALAHLWLLFM